MRILITNDDGIYADGLYALYQEIKKVAHVTVVAPDSERSSIAHAITLAHPLRVKKMRLKHHKTYGYAVSGTPADCVKFALSEICKKKPDLIVSGINCGDNDGCSVFYSGTVAGAREGALNGIPSLAISLATFSNPEFTYSAKFGVKLAKAVLKYGLPKGTFLNVNVPNKKPRQIRGIQITRQGMIPIAGKFHKRLDLNSKEYYWLTGKLPERKKDLTVDTHALYHNYVTITPIHCDSTDYISLEEMNRWKIQ